MQKRKLGTDVEAIMPTEISRSTTSGLRSFVLPGLRFCTVLAFLPEFLQLTKIPIILYYGDNIPAQPMAVPSQDQWRVRLAMSRLWADAVNRCGGDVTVVHLPEIGVRANTHFPFSDV
jgi:hypothetical protein